MTTLWLLERITETDYDQCCGFVVRADDEHGARTLAAGQAADEGARTWTDASRSTCARLYEDGAHCVVMRDFRAG